MAKPVIINHTIDAISEEQTITLPTRVVDLKIRLRDNSDVIKVAFESGESGTNYITMDADLPVMQLEDVYMINEKLYVQSADTDPVLEVLAMTE